MVLKKSSKTEAIIDFFRRTTHRIHRLRIMVFKNKDCTRSKKIGARIEIDNFLGF
jgi:hypothetical protein